MTSKEIIVKEEREKKKTMMLPKRLSLWNQVINGCQSKMENVSLGGLKQELLTLVHGNPATANRLLNGEKRLHPNHKEKWYLEKVIYDLQRGR